MTLNWIDVACLVWPMAKLTSCRVTSILVSITLAELLNFCNVFLFDQKRYYFFIDYCKPSPFNHCLFVWFFDLIDCLID